MHTVKVEDYRGMIVSEAYKVWSRLPKQTRNWLGVDDLVADGMAWAWKLSQKKKWDPTKGASFGTYVKGHLFYHFDNHFIAPYQTAQQRCETNTVSIQGLAERTGMGPNAYEFFMKDQPQTDMPDCMAVETLLAIYNDASPDLREQIVIWFLQSGTAHLSTKGKRFNRYREEFRALAAKHHCSYSDCAHVMRSPVCLDHLSRVALWIPYDLNDPTPGLRTA